MTYEPPPWPDGGGVPERYPSPFSQPHPGSPALIPPPPPQLETVPAMPRVARRGRRPSVWLFGALVVVSVALIGYFLTFLGAGASILGFAMALVPFVGVLFAVRLIDRWEPEPRGLLVFAVAWGAIASVAIALLVDLGISGLIGNDGSALRQLFSAVVQAPVVEEVGKGLGLLLIYATARRAFDGPVDGVVYGALVGAGFALTENVQYFAVSYLEGGLGEVTGTFFVRGILSPFAHAMFTAVIGFALGLAARRGTSVAGAMGPWLGGVAGAVVLHAFWNGSALLGDFFALYVTLQVPLFALFILGVLALKREEARLTHRRLGEYAAAGWFTAEEVDMLATGSGRRQALEWARTLRTDRRTVMRTFIHDAAALAAARQRALSGRDPRAAEDERVLLERTALARQALFSL
ncbi:PrsW family intramembrane metalloprotease [Microbacterium sp. LRZ72]|uniref:PrsW family intramembrane metalloprotease n=1 Tax=Microbacterium sp. LRZ72 TaxID=2942481 RepID=UPI0029BE4C19|nr:PrsW family intramembrane metalloprotease [Microbacterium sp. LRZ72]MDX2377420.1 PrsW family intramembrane metalloprotease [Microbacterium sp. LRZ72]